jgi:hypothetical protein
MREADTDISNSRFEALKVIVMVVVRKAQRMLTKSLGNELNVSRTSSLPTVEPEAPCYAQPLPIDSSLLSTRASAALVEKMAGKRVSTTFTVRVTPEFRDPYAGLHLRSRASN